MQDCEACGAGLPAGAAFCWRCGVQLRAVAPQGSAAGLHRSERKIVTVLFADVKGSLDLVLGEDPERASEVLSDVVARMSEAVRRHGGVVNQVLGDGIMALFGAPVAMEDHAMRACVAALEMRGAIAASVRPAVHLRVGLGSGEVVVGGVLGDVGRHYSAAGEPVHLAARMEAAADPDQILLTDGTRHLAAATIEVRRRRGVPIKGHGDGTPVFELIGMRRSAHAAAPGARLFGRDREIDLLLRARDRAGAGDGQAVRMVGDAGSGKSTLLREFTDTHLSDDWTVLQAGAVPHRRTSYAVTSDLLGQLFKFAAGDDAAVRRDKVADSLQLSPMAMRDLLVPLSPLLELDAPSREWNGLEANVRHERTLAATVEAFALSGARQQLALVVEDSHWMDAESAAGIKRLGRTASGRRMLGLVTARATHAAEDAEWEDGAWAQCAVAPLEEGGTLALLRSRVIPGPDVAALERKLIEHTKGNPLFIEECLQALVEGGRLVRDGALLRLVAPVPSLGVPTSLRGLLDARVDRLEGGDKDVLQAASVVGTRVPLDLLLGVTEVGAAGLQASLRRLEEGGFLAMKTAGDYGFRHGLIREAAYNSLLKRSRVRMHGAVLTLLEARTEMTGAEVDLLANHALEAEAWPQAARYAQQAAVRAFGRYANPEAVHYYGQALTAARHLEGAEKDGTLLDLLVSVRTPLFRLGDVRALGPHLDEAVRLAERTSQGGALHEGLAQALVLRSHVHWLRGEPTDALDDAETADGLATRHGDDDLAVRVRFQRGLVGLSSADVPGVLGDMGAVVAHMRDASQRRYGLDVDLVVTAHSYMARAHAMAGNLVAARHEADLALRLAATLERRHNTIYAHLADGVVALAEGRPGAALLTLAEADELCRGGDIRLLSPVAAQLLAQAHLACGSAAKALPIARQAVEDAERMGFMAMHSNRLAILADALLASGMLTDAENTARAAQALAARQGEAGAEAVAHMVLADVLDRQRQDGSEAVEAAEDLLAAHGLVLEAFRPPVRRGRDAFGG